MIRKHLCMMGGKSSRGAVAPTVALSLFALVGAGGLAFDYARMATLDTELQNAADHAALAAASQLDGEAGTCERAVAAARELLANRTLMANDGGGLAVTIAASGVCNADDTITDNASATVRFFQNKAGTILATNDGNANFVEVTVDARRADYALTPVVGAISSGNIAARARAGLGTALCKVPPLMVCPPANAPANWNDWRGRGIRAVSNSGNNWAPGAFGYIGPQDANSTQIALAFQNPIFQCQEVEGSEPVSTGQPAPAIVAINTRFDIYDMSGGGGQVLTPCLGSSCPPAVNVTKDLVRAGDASGGNACRIHNTGWRLPTNRFSPRARNVADLPMTQIDSDNLIDAMGLPRDNCHYTSYGTACSDGRFGDGNWARGDYFNKYHPANIPAGADTMSRYDVYLWEITNSRIPNDTPNNTSAVGQRGTAVCNLTVPDPTRDRRVLQVAIAGNCPSLQGASTPVQIQKWVEMFLVEPGVASPGRGNGDGGNEIYLEVIREVTPGGSAAQLVRRDTPYLVR